VPRLRAGRTGFDSRQGLGFFFSPWNRVETGSGAQPVSYPKGTWALIPGVQWKGSEADHSPPRSAEVKNAWSYTSILQYAFMVWCLISNEYVLMAWYLVKHRDNFKFIYLSPLKIGDHVSHLYKTNGNPQMHSFRNFCSHFCSQVGTRTSEHDIIAVLMILISYHVHVLKFQLHFLLTCTRLCNFFMEFVNVKVKLPLCSP
jgi:hypothetical protein